MALEISRNGEDGEHDDDGGGMHDRASNSTKYRSNIPSLVAAFSAALTTGGTTYAFSIYGNDLKKSLNLSASELDTLSTAFFFAGLASWIPGLIADRLGTRFTIALGGLLGASSLLSYWVVATKWLVLPRSLLVPVLSVLGIAIFLSCAFVTGSVFKILVSCCGAGTKGSAVGVAKGYVGLGSGAYACLFTAIRRPKETTLDFLPMAAFFFVACATIPALLLLPTKRQMETEVIQDNATPTHFHVLFASLGAMAILVAGNSVMELLEDRGSGNSAPDGVQPETGGVVVSGGGRHWGMAFILVTAWLAPIVSLLYLPSRRNANLDRGIAVPVDDEDDELEDTDENEVAERRATEEGNAVSATGAVYFGPKNRRESESSRGDISLHKVQARNDNDSDMTEEETRPLHDSSERGEGRGLPTSEGSSGEPDGIMQQSPSQELTTDEENLNLLQMLRTPSAMLMLWTTTVLVGAGTVMTNNLGEMVESLGFAEATTPAALALFSVAQAAGRVATGAVSESALNWNTRRFCIDNGIPRPFFLVLASCIGFMSHLILGTATHEFFFVLATSASGVAFGMVWPLMVLIVGEVFGTANAGANYMFYDGFTSAIGTLLLTKILAQDIYEKHIDPDAEDKSTCVGTGCFQATHIAVAFLSLSCVLTSTTMMYTSRRTYNKARLHRS